MFNLGAFSGLKYLINYHRITGTTYFGATIDGKPVFLRKVILVSWNLLFLAVAIQHTTNEILHVIRGQPASHEASLSLDNSSKHFVGDTHINETAKQRSQKTLIDVLHSIRCISRATQTLIICLYLMVRGNKILQSVKDCLNLVRVSDRDGKRIGLTVALAHFTYAFVFNLVHGVVHIQENEGPPSVSQHIAPTLLFFTLFNIELTIISLIAYQSLIVRKKLKEISHNFSVHMNLKNTYLFISRLNDSIRRTDDLICVYNVLVLANASISCISFTCMLAVDTSRKGIDVSALLESFSVLLFFCLVSDIIPETYRQFMHKLNHTFTEYSVQNSASNLIYNRVILNHMNDIRHEIGFTAYNLFFINKNTFLSCMTLILSYSVILIQTYSPSN